MGKRHNINEIDNFQNKKKIQINIVGCILAMIAGWINAVGINLFLTESPAFLSGRGLILGYWAFKGDIKTFVSVGLVIISFIIGSIISTKVTKKHGLSGGLFFVAFLISISAIPISLRNIIIDTIIISMAMGAQNAATSLTAINRTTHLTGPATDIGINIAEKKWNRAAFWILRWISFPIGAVIGFIVVDNFDNGTISLSMTLLLPAIIIFLVGVVQSRFLHIPLRKPIER